MASCNITVSLAEPDREFEPGDTIRGHVIVDVDGDVRCDGLNVEHRWKTHGRGNTETHAVGAVTVFEGEWEEGERYRYAFEFEQPPGPQSYHGHYLNVDWYIHATADIPWALDPDGEVDHLARYRGSAQDYEAGSPDAPDHEGGETQTSVGCSGCLGAAGLCVLVIGFGLVVKLGLQGLFEGTLGGVAMILVGGVLAYNGLSAYFARKRLGDVEVVAEPGQMRAGDSLTCTVTIKPPRDVELNEISQTLVAAEVVVRGSGTNKRTYRHELHEQVETTNWAEPRTLAAGQSHTFERTFVIPEDAPPSFDSAGDNKLEWSIATHVDIPAWPDFKTSNVVIVAPRAPEPTLDDADEPTEQTTPAQDWW